MIDKLYTDKDGIHYKEAIPLIFDKLNEVIDYLNRHEHKYSLGENKGVEYRTTYPPEDSV